MISELFLDFFYLMISVYYEYILFATDLQSQRLDGPLAVPRCGWQARGRDEVRDRMTPHIIRVEGGFWNIRGSFKVGGIIDVGTHGSLVRRQNGRFVLLDACPLSQDAEGELRKLTHDGEDLEAILNVHPFHTVYVSQTHERFPKAKLYGTARHHARLSELPWEAERTEDPSLHALFSEDFEFSVPRGVDFISKNENVHFSSVMVYHRASKTIHVDDTLMYVRMPKLVRMFKADLLRFHPTLGQALERRAGATEDFRAWARELAGSWGEAENLCAAHTATLLARSYRGEAIGPRILQALDKVSDTLDKHERQHG